MNRDKQGNGWMHEGIDWVDSRLDFWNRRLSGKEGWVIFASFFMVTSMSLLSYTGFINLIPINGVLWLLLTVFFTTVSVMLFWGASTVYASRSGSEKQQYKMKDSSHTKEAGKTEGTLSADAFPRRFSYSRLSFIALAVLSLTLLLTGIFISHTKLFYAFFCGLMGLFTLHITRRGDGRLLAQGMAKGLLLGGSFLFLLSFLLEPMSDTTYYGVFTNPNNLEPLASLLMVSGLHLLVNEQTKHWRILSLLGIALATIGGVASRSRTFQLVILILALAWIVFTVRHFQGKKRISFLVIPALTMMFSLPIFIYLVRPVFYGISQKATFLLVPYQEAKAELVRRTEARVKQQNHTKQAVSYKAIGIPEWVSGNEVISKLFSRVGGTMEAFDDVLKSEIEMPNLEKEMAEEKRSALVDQFFDQIPASQQNTNLSRFMNKSSLFFALDGITTHRLNIWTTFLENTHLLGQPVPSLIVFGYGISGYPHNLLIQIGVDSGLFGGLAFLYLFVRAGIYVLLFLFRKSKKGRKGAESLLFFPFAMLVVMVSGMLSNGNVPFSNFIFFAYLSSWSIYLKRKEWERL